MRVVQVSLSLVRIHVHRGIPVAQNLKGGVGLLGVVHDHMVVVVAEDMVRARHVDHMGLGIAQAVDVHMDQATGVGVGRKDREEHCVGVGRTAAGVVDTAMFVLGTEPPAAAAGYETADSPLVPRKAVRELGTHRGKNEVVHKAVGVVRSLELRAELVVHKVPDNHRRNRLLLL